MANHTPGPWTYQFAENGGYDCMTDAFHIHASENPFIVTDIDLGSYGQRCDPPWPNARDRAEADARLIAAAPDMLAALREAREQFYNERHSSMNEAQFTESVAFIDRVIAKAEPLASPAPRRTRKDEK